MVEDGGSKSTVDSGRRGEIIGREMATFEELKRVRLLVFAEKKKKPRSHVGVLL